MHYGWDIRAIAPGLDVDAIRDRATDRGYLTPGGPHDPAGEISLFMPMAFAASFDRIEAARKTGVVHLERFGPIITEEIAGLLAYGYAATERAMQLAIALRVVRECVANGPWHAAAREKMLQRIDTALTTPPTEPQDVISEKSGNSD